MFVSHVSATATLDVVTLSGGGGGVGGLRRGAQVTLGHVSPSLEGKLRSCSEASFALAWCRIDNVLSYRHEFVLPFSLLVVYWLDRCCTAALSDGNFAGSTQRGPVVFRVNALVLLLGSLWCFFGGMWLLLFYVLFFVCFLGGFSRDFISFDPVILFIKRDENLFQNVSLEEHAPIVYIISQYVAQF